MNWNYFSGPKVVKVDNLEKSLKYEIISALGIMVCFRDTSTGLCQYGQDMGEK
jgi:hypothetical protein